MANEQAKSLFKQLDIRNAGQVDVIIVGQSSHFYLMHIKKHLQISKDDVYDALQRLELELDAETLIMTLGLNEKDSIDFDQFAQCIFGISDADSDSDPDIDNDDGRFSHASLEDLNVYGLSQEELLVDDMVCIWHAFTHRMEGNPSRPSHRITKSSPPHLHSHM